MASYGKDSENRVRKEKPEPGFFMALYLFIMGILIATGALGGAIAFNIWVWKLVVG
jgi:hypothetical protein